MTGIRSRFGRDPGKERIYSLHARVDPYEYAMFTRNGPQCGICSSWQHPCQSCEAGGGTEVLAWIEQESHRAKARREFDELFALVTEGRVA